MKPRLARVALLCGVAAVAIAPVTVNNYRVSKTFLLVTTTGGSNLLKGNGPTATGSHAFLPLGAQATGVAAHLEGRVNPRAAAAQSKVLAAQARSYMLAHPGRTLGLFGKKLLLQFNHYEWGIRDQFHFTEEFVPLLRWVPVRFWIVVPLGLVGALLALGAWRRTGILHAVILVQIASFMLIFVLARYRLVLVACLMPFAAWLILRGLDWVREKAVRPLALSLACVLVVFAIGSIRFAHPRHGDGFADQWAFVAATHAEQGRLEEAVAAYRSALQETWVDPRRARDDRWRLWIRLVETQVMLGRDEAARQNLASLTFEVRRFFNEGEHPIEPKIRELRERIGVLR